MDRCRVWLKGGRVLTKPGRVRPGGDQRRRKRRRVRDRDEYIRRTHLIDLPPDTAYSPASIADLSCTDQMDTSHLAEALQYRPREMGQDLTIYY